MTNIFEEDVETYTRLQAMQLLDVSRAAVIQLENTGILDKRTYLKGTRDVVHYTKASVDELLAKRANHTTISDLEKRWGMSRTMITRIAENHGIEFFEDNTLYLKKIRVITNETASKLNQILKSYIDERDVNLARKTEFKIGEYVLFQSFADSSGNLYRLVKNKDTAIESNEYGFYIDNKFVLLNDALPNGLKPLYELADVTALKRPFIEIHAPLQDGTTKIFLDVCYQNLGHRNMFLTTDKNLLKIFVKESILPISDKARTILSNGWLDKIKIIDGDIQIDDNIYIVSSYKPHTFNIKKSIGQQIEDLSNQYDISKGELIELAIRKLLEDK